MLKCPKCGNEEDFGIHVDTYILVNIVDGKIDDVDKDSETITGCTCGLCGEPIELTQEDYDKLWEAY